MLWTALAAVVGAAGIALGFILLRRRRPGARVSPADSRARGIETEDSVSLIGLMPADAARLRRSARAEMAREQAQWGRDYVPAVSEAALPGRIAGLPRTLRVRQ